jgi:AbrB family looped-hinge helix DNA binding protein
MVRVQQQNGTFSVTIPKDVAEDLDLTEGESVIVGVDGDAARIQRGASVWRSD